MYNTRPKAIKKGSDNMSKKNPKLTKLEEEFNIDNLYELSDEDFYGLILRFTIAKDIFLEEKKAFTSKKKRFSMKPKVSDDTLEVERFFNRIKNIIDEEKRRRKNIKVTKQANAPIVELYLKMLNGDFSETIKDEYKQGLLQLIENDYHLGCSSFEEAYETFKTLIETNLKKRLKETI